jgi:paraquat-inducible protein B
MTENNQSATKAHVKAARPVSMIWLIPIVAIFIGSWMVFQNWKNQGPLITIEFKTASGIEVGTTKIKSLNVDIGQVTKVDIKPDLDGVIVTARLSSPDYDALLRGDTNFWVVSPQVTRAGISGLHTLLSGPYIELYPGTGEVEQYNFEGLETPPLTPTGTPGLSVTLSSEHDFSFTAGDPIIYKGFNVGKIEDIYFNSDENTMYYNAFIEAPYHTLIRSNTRFWKMSGVELDVSADGLKLQTGTLETIMRGGVTFGLPKDEVLGEMIEGRGYFDIYPDEQAILDERYGHKMNYILLVEDSIRGIQIGAPVEFRGVKVGQVVRTDLAYHQINNLLDKDSLIPILIELEPGRMGLSDDPSGVDKLKQDLALWVEKGLKASLITGNLVTGSQLVELAYFDLDEAASLSRFQQYSVIPLVPNKFSRVGIEIGELVNKLNNLPIGSVASETEAVLIETKHILAKLQRLPLESVVNNADQVFMKTDKMVEQLTRSVTTLEQILANTNDAQLPQTMNDTLRSVDTILLDLKPLLLHLKNKPNGLIFSGQVGDTIEPKKGE